jgi:hypothetical protein
MRVIALIEDATVVRAILTHLGCGDLGRPSAPRPSPRGPGRCTPICRSRITLYGLLPRFKRTKDDTDRVWSWLQPYIRPVVGALLRLLDVMGFRARRANRSR